MADETLTAMVAAVDGGKRIDPLHDPRVSDIDVLIAARSIMEEDGYPVDDLTHAIETREQGGCMPAAPVASPPPTRSQQREWDRLRDYREQRGMEGV